MYPIEELDVHLPFGNSGFDMGPPTGLGPSSAARQHMPSMQGMAPDPYPQAQHSYNYDPQRVSQQQHNRARTLDPRLE